MSAGPRDSNTACGALLFSSSFLNSKIGLPFAQP